MIQGYRMVGPPPQGEPPTPPTERAWPLWSGFVALAAVFFVSNVAYAIIAGVSGVDIDDTPAWLDLTAGLILQASLIAGALGAAALIKPLHAWQFGLRPTRFWPALGWTAAAFAAFFLFTIAWATLVDRPEQTTAEDLGARESDLALVAAGAMFVLIAPIAEEIFFRGFFYGSLRTKLSVGWAAVICGVVFGGIHVLTGPSAVPLLIVFGIFLCLLRERTGSLYPCIGLHAFNNMLAYIALDDVNPGIAGAFGAAVLLGCSLVPRLAWREPPQPSRT